MEHPNSSGPESPDYQWYRDPVCMHNYELEKAIFMTKGYWSQTSLPGDWKEHVGCFQCGMFIKLLMKPDKPLHGNQANPLQSYAFTLTMPPGYEPKKPLQEVAKMIMEHGITNKPYEKAIEWAFVLEHTEQGTPHIHGMYKTNSGRRIASKYFQRYWPLWDEKTKLGNGHKGGYHNRARHDQSYIAYMAKEGVIMTNAVANGNF